MARVCQLTDDPSGPTVQADCYEGLFWKSHATAELVAKMENAEYVLHQPFNRQIKKMAQGGFPMAAATMDDWHQAACGMIEPLYGGTLSDSVSLGDNRNPRLPRQHPQQVWAWQGRHYGQPEGLDRLALFLHIITIITAFLRLHSCKVQEISLSLYFNPSLIPH